MQTTIRSVSKTQISGINGTRSRLTELFMAQVDEVDVEQSEFEGVISAGDTVIMGDDITFVTLKASSPVTVSYDGNEFIVSAWHMSTDEAKRYTVKNHQAVPVEVQYITWRSL
ncbi:hypothetical protein [Vibrio phage YC]|uniref:Uncharacterized protein n=1 Tax=Vibrio phage YC TaxID=2267403 RepID=A0A384ZS80_9CAUD|nr:hypothetical protein HWB64_gp105 [Vibrio phage YC]AXC34474.1 hypothetical protein [Vibrio phage YC]